MGLTFDSTTDRLKTNNAISGNFTLMTWWLSTNFATRWQTPIQMGGTSTGSTSIFLQVNPATSKTEIYALNTGPVGGAGPTVLSTSTWYHLALTGNTGTSQTFTSYVNGVLEATGTGGVGTYAQLQTEFGNWNSGESTTGQLGVCKSWSAQLTAAEIQFEMLSIMPIRITNLYGWWPCWSATDTLDYSGNVGRGLTATNLTDGTNGPPVGWASFMPQISIAPIGAGIFPPFAPRPGALLTM